MPKPTGSVEDQSALEKEMTGEVSIPAPEVKEPDLKGEEAPVKGKETPAAKPADEDPEFDLGGDLGKVKRSQVTGWKKGGMLEEDYRKKTEELSAKEKELKSLAEMSDFLAKNPKKLQKVLAVLQEAEDAAEAAAAGEGTKKAAADAAGDAKDAIAAVLEKLDPEDPAGLILKEIYTELKGLSKKVQDVEAKELKQQEAEQVKAQRGAVDYARNVIKKTVADIEPSQNFETDEEKTAWRQMTLSILKDNPKNYRDEEDFVKAVKEAGESAGKRIKAMVEANLKKYLEKKSGPTLPGPGAGGAAEPKKFTMGTLQETLERELEAASGA